ncbi:MAG TPA: OstA family protein, partial [Erythrobacter sp.]|nr:OstA family protein [Erythrobacter sp.]
MKPLLSTIARWGIGSFAVTAAGFAGIQLSAQAIASHNSNAPVSYAADRIELQDRENRVVLSGNVQITQAGLGLSAARTIVSYSDAGSLSIQRIMATGGGTVSRGNERARGDTAGYDFN